MTFGMARSSSRRIETNQRCRTTSDAQSARSTRGQRTRPRHCLAVYGRQGSPIFPSVKSRIQKGRGEGETSPAKVGGSDQTVHGKHCPQKPVSFPVQQPLIYSMITNGMTTVPDSWFKVWMGTGMPLSTRRAKLP